MSPIAKVIEVDREQELLNEKKNLEQRLAQITLELNEIEKKKINRM